MCIKRNFGSLPACSTLLSWLSRRPCSNWTAFLHTAMPNAMLPVYEMLASDAPRSSRSVAHQPGIQELHDDADSSSSISTDVRVPGVPRRPVRSWPLLRTLLPDFTLGFADGLTVPFALTAGLSSLGQTSTVIYAGMAEICAGSISMGIGGYLAARGEARAASASREGQEPARAGEDAAGLLSSDCGDLEKRGSLSDDGGDMSAITRHLVPLRLPPDLEDAVLAHLRRHGYDRRAIAETASPQPPAEEPSSFPRLTGLSVSLGYLVGGIIPLFPYFFVREVGTGLFCSFLVCILALFVFGFGKDFALNGSNGREMDEKRIPWSRIRSSLWEGFLMVVLGGTAAVAAVLCVRLFDGVL